jgi:hypothetical protein
VRVSGQTGTNKIVMKKNTAIFLLVFLPFLVKATNYTSIISGNWSSSSTWSPTGVPGSGDNVTIATSVTVNGNDNVNNITINGSQALTVSGSNTLTVYGTFINNGTFSPGIGTVSFYATSNDTIGGTTSTSFYNVNFRDLTSSVVKYLTSNINVQGSLTLYPGGTLNMNGKNITIAGNWINNIVAGQGNFISGSETVTFNGSSTQAIGGTTTTTFPNLVISPGSTVQLATSTIVNDNFTVSSGTFNLSSSSYLLTVSGNFTNNGTFNAGNGTVSLFASQNDIIGGSSSISFYNLIIRVYYFGTYTESLASNIAILGSLTINAGGNLNMNGKNITITGNWINNRTTGSFTAGTGIVTFNGSSTQIIGGTTSTIFTNLTSASTDTVQLGVAGTTVNNNFIISSGIFDCQNYQVTGNTSGTLTLAANTGLVLGLPSSTTNISFPTSFTTAHTTLNSSSTVNYQANVAQTISNTPSSYGSLIVSTGATATTKTLGGNITVNGNLIINANTTLDCEAYQITGTSSGIMTMASGSGLKLGATGTATSISFPLNFVTGNITLNATSTVIYQANTSQPVSINPATYGNLVLSTTGSKTPASSPLNIAGNLTINSGTTLPEGTGTINLTGNLTNSGTLTFSSGALSIGGNFTNNGTFTYSTSTVTFNGSSGQSIS